MLDTILLAFAVFFNALAWIFLIGKMTIFRFYLILLLNAATAIMLISYVHKAKR